MDDEPTPWEDDELAPLNEVLLQAAHQPWTREKELRFIALRDQIRAAIREGHPNLADSLPPMNELE